MQSIIIEVTGVILCVLWDRGILLRYNVYNRSECEGNKIKKKKKMIKLFTNKMTERKWKLYVNYRGIRVIYVCL